MEYAIHCLPCSYANEAIDLSSKILRNHIDIKVTSSGQHSAKGVSETFDNSVVAMVTNKCRHWCKGYLPWSTKFTLNL